MTRDLRRSSQSVQHPSSILIHVRTGPSLGVYVATYNAKISRNVDGGRSARISLTEGVISLIKKTSKCKQTYPTCELKEMDKNNFKPQSSDEGSMEVQSVLHPDQWNPLNPRTYKPLSNAPSKNQRKTWCCWDQDRC